MKGSIITEFTIVIYGSPARVRALIAEEWMRESVSDGLSALRYAEWRRPPETVTGPLDVLRVQRTDIPWKSLVPPCVWDTRILPLMARLTERQDHLMFEATIYNRFFTLRECHTSTHHRGMILSERARSSDPSQPLWVVDDLTRPAGPDNQRLPLLTE